MSAPRFLQDVGPSRSGDEPNAPVTSMLAGRLFLVGGALWTAAALIGGDDGTTRFRVAEVVWLSSHVVLLLATLRLWRAGLHRPGRMASVGFGLAVAGRITFSVAELVALAVDETQDVLLPIAALATAIGTVIIGASVARAGRWPGPSRLVLLVSGLYPFVAMFPFAASDADGPPPASLIGWGVLTMLVGVAPAFARSPTSDREAG